MSTDINKRLELLRRIKCLGYDDIVKAFKGFHIEDHLITKYENCCKKNPSYGVFDFIFDLDSNCAERFFESIGYNAVDLGEKKRY